MLDISYPQICKKKLAGQRPASFERPVARRPPFPLRDSAWPGGTLFRRLARHRVIGMRGPVGVVRRNRLAGALVERAHRQRLHGDAALDWADIDAQIAAD